MQRAFQKIDQILVARTDFASKAFKGGYVMEGKSRSRLRCTLFEQFYLRSPRVEPSSRPHGRTPPLWCPEARPAGHGAVVLGKGTTSPRAFGAGSRKLPLFLCLSARAWPPPSQSHPHCADAIQHQAEPRGGTDACSHLGPCWPFHDSASTLL